MKTLTAETAGEVIDALAQGYGVQEVAAAFGVSRQSISAIKHGRAWGHLPRPAAAPAAMQETRRGAAVYRVQRGDRR